MQIYKCNGNPPNTISKNIHKCQAHGGATQKVRISPKSVLFILWEQESELISLQSFHWTDQQTKITIPAIYICSMYYTHNNN